MKRFMMMTFAVCAMFSISAFAQGSMGSMDHDSMKSDNSKKTSAKSSMAADTTVAGTITTDKAGKPALKADSDGKVWTVDNPDAVKGHEGHHVNVTGSPNPKKNTIHVSKVDMAADSMKGDSMKGDSMKSDTSKGKKKKGTKSGDSMKSDTSKS